MTEIITRSTVQHSIDGIRRTLDGKVYADFQEWADDPELPDVDVLVTHGGQTRAWYNATTIEDGYVVPGHLPAQLVTLLDPMMGSKVLARGVRGATWATPEQFHRFPDERSMLRDLWLAPQRQRGYILDVVVDGSVHPDAKDGA